MRYFIHLAYNGTRFCGWQIQPHSPSVQETITCAISKLLGDSITITGAGRTDSGVHASCYYAHFETEKEFSNQDLTYKLNRILPYDIVIYSIFPVSNDIHARFSATKRTYTYSITKQKDPFHNETSYYYPKALNITTMNEAAQNLIGTHDFASFCKLHSDVSNTFCTIYTAQWTDCNETLIFTITANRFLRNMVRAIVGTLIEVGNGKISIDDFKHIIESKNRCNAGQSIPAQGLSLVNITYPELYIL